MQANAFRHNGTAEGHGGEGGENGLLSKWVRADKHHRTTTVFKISIFNHDKSSRSHTADTEEGRRTTQRAVSQRERLEVAAPCTNM